MHDETVTTASSNVLVENLDWVVYILTEKLGPVDAEIGAFETPL